jgi:hypothetical protein
MSDSKPTLLWSCIDSLPMHWSPERKLEHWEENGKPVDDVAKRIREIVSADDRALAEAVILNGMSDDEAAWRLGKATTTVRGLVERFCNQLGINPQVLRKNSRPFKRPRISGLADHSRPSEKFLPQPGEVLKLTRQHKEQIKTERNASTNDDGRQKRCREAERNATRDTDMRWDSTDGPAGGEKPTAWTDDGNQETADVRHGLIDDDNDVIGHRIGSVRDGSRPWSGFDARGRFEKVGGPQFTPPSLLEDDAMHELRAAQWAEYEQLENDARKSSRDHKYLSAAELRQVLLSTNTTEVNTDEIFEPTLDQS